MPRESLRRLRTLELPVDFIIGNGELAVLAESEGTSSGVPAQYLESIRWNATQLRESDRAYLASWARSQRMQINGLGNVLFCHATPNNPHDTFTRLTPDELVVSLIGKVDADLLVCGHTHMQFDRH